jgi:hypothetical protein
MILSLDNTKKFFGLSIATGFAISGVILLAEKVYDIAMRIFHNFAFSSSTLDLGLALFGTIYLLRYTFLLTASILKRFSHLMGIEHWKPFQAWKIAFENPSFIIRAD